MLNFFGHLAGDRRNAYRRLLNIPVRYRLRNSAAEHSSLSENISEVGIFFETEFPIRIGAILEVLLCMPGAINGELASLWYTGHVVRVDSKGSKRGVGVQFDCFEVVNREEFAQGLAACAAI